MYRASSGGWGHRAVYMGAIVATAALIAGFGGALLVYGPLGQQQHQLIGSNLNTPPRGVTFGNASVVFASQLGNISNGSGWDYNSSTGQSMGPCNGSGIFDPVTNTSIYQNQSDLNATNPYNITGNVTLVCLNSVNGGILGATWYNETASGLNLTDNYTAGGVPIGSYFNDSLIGNISSCNGYPSLFQMYNELNTTYTTGNTSLVYLPCETYFEMDNNTTWLPSLNGNITNATNDINGTLWSPNQSGYLPGDLIYTVPVHFSNASTGAYELSVDIEGVTPVAQTFLFNYTQSATNNTTVLFTFDMTAAWLMDLSTAFNNTTYNLTGLAIYGSINVVSAIVDLCAYNSVTAAPECPVATPSF